MLARRALPQAKLGATNVSVFMKWTTKVGRGSCRASAIEGKPGRRLASPSLTFALPTDHFAKAPQLASAKSSIHQGLESTHAETFASAKSEIRRSRSNSSMLGKFALGL